MWEVCSNGYAQMPTSEVGFMPVEEIDTTAQHGAKNSNVVVWKSQLYNCLG